MLLHINPTRQRGKRTGSLARASGWYMTFFAAGVIAGAIGQVENLLTNGKCAEESLRRTARFSHELEWFSWDGKEASHVAHTVRSKTRA